MVCTACGAENRPGRKFCARCAAPLVLLCARCQSANEHGERYCGECGAALPAEIAGRAPAGQLPIGPPTHPSPVAEHRLVTVLFADLVGFTPFAEERDSEEVRETLTRYFDLASDIIGRYGGSVEKFIGDAVMAAWGTPTSHEDDAERAVRAALELVDAVRSLGPGIAARVGVLTGEASVTLGATNQGMVAGDLVNTASRLQSVAQPGSVLVGEATCRAASAAIAFEPAGEQTLKGKAAPVPAFHALRVIAERGGRGRSETLEAPFVGRDEELRLLKDLYHATVREGRVRLVSVIGPAGIGKSRLAWEFEKYLDGLVDGHRWHRGRSPAYGSGITFWALGEMIRGRAGLAETDDERTTRTAIGALLDGIGLSDADRRWIEPALLALLGIESGSSPEQLFGAWRTFFERLAASGPVVLVFEDLHWADPGTLDFIDHLLEWSRSIPLYIVTLGRPELLERRSDWGAGRRNFTSLYLEPLSEPAVRALLADLVPGLPEPAASAIVARAEGIPLYAIETIRMLLAEGRLTPRDDGTYEPAGELGSVPVPETLTALIASRLDGLEPPERSLLLDASVLGQSFTLAGLTAVSGIEAAALEPHLRSLVRREFLASDTDPRSPERGQYAFVQALLREVAYHTLARRDRKTRHLAAARYFETLDTDELAGALAGHYLAAHDDAPEGPERDALAAQARVALRAAAERAAALGAHDGALVFLDQASSATSDPTERAELLERAGQEASAAGRHDAAERHARAALELRRELGDRPAIARAITVLGHALLDDYRIPAALAILEPASAEFADLANDPAVIALDGQLARAYFLADDDPERAVEIADRVLAAAEHADLREILADTLITKGSALAQLSRMVEGLALIRAGKELAETLGVVALMSRGSSNLGAYQGELDPRASLETHRVGLALDRRAGARHGVAINLGDAADAALRTGDWSWAMGELDAALAEDWEASDRSFLAYEAFLLHALRGEPAAGMLDELTGLLRDAATDPAAQRFREAANAYVALVSGRLTEAREAWHRVIAFTPVNLRYPRPWVFGARAALWARDATGAREDLVGLDATGVHGPAVEASRTTIRAGLAALEGRVDDALPLYRAALQSWRDLGLAWDEALAGIDMATLLDPAEPDVRAAAGRSRELLVGLGAAPFVERLDTALARDVPVEG